MAQAPALLDFLHHAESDTIYLVGDNFIGEFEENLSEVARRKGADGVLRLVRCGVPNARSGVKPQVDPVTVAA